MTFLKPDVDADKAALEVEEWKQKQKERFKNQLQGMALPVVEFSRERYKIRKVFA